MRVIKTLPQLKRAIADYQAQNETIALVPTMGALHAGHFSLVEIAQKRANRIIVSIFVNPAQFGPHEDLGTYPRTFAADRKALEALNADAIWAPDDATMYPDGFATRIVPEGAASVGLEDKFRPHFFSGVATVVGKLLIQCEPDFALFGEKDFQQLKVVTQMARDLGLKTKIVGVPIVREADGLALSSRNRYLSDAERAVAPALHRVLSECASAISTGKGITAALRHGREALTKTGFAVDYLEARDAETLMPVGTSTSGKIRLLVAARIGGTRLIDNVGV
ncbi:MAG: pantoate--beta-alanine ligase [Xanthobacteraceae bacterium]